MSSLLNRNTASAVAVFALNASIGFALVRIIVGSLGRDAYGVYVTLSQTISNACLLLFVFNNNAFREVGMYHRDARQAAQRLGWTCSLNVLGFFLVLPLLLGFSFASPYLFTIPSDLIPSAVSLAVLVSLSSLLTSSGSVIGALYVFKNESWMGNLVLALSGLLRFFVILVCFYLHALTLTNVGLAALLGAVFATVFYLLLWRYRYRFLSLRLSLPPVRQTLSDYVAGFHSFFGRGFDTLIVNYELLLVNHLDLATASLYATLLPVFTAARLLSSFVYSSLEPAWLLLREHGRLPELFAHVNAVQRQALRAGLVPACLVALWANELVRLWLGTPDSQLAHLIEIYFPPFAAVICFSSYHNLFYVLHDQTWSNLAGGAVVVLMTVACSLLASVGRLDGNHFVGVLLCCYALKNCAVLPLLLRVRYRAFSVPTAALGFGSLLLSGYYALRCLRGWSSPETWSLLRLGVCVLACLAALPFAWRGLARRPSASAG